MNFNYLATPNVTIGVNGNYSEQRFSDSDDAGSGLTNSTTIGGNASVSYRFSPRTSLGILVAGNHQTYENTPDSDTLSGGILFEYQFSPVFRLDGVFGMSYIRQSEAPGIPEQQTSAPSGIFNASYTSETFTASVYGSAVYSGGSGFGEATRQWTAGLAFNDQFTREWSWNLSGTYQVSKSVFETDAVNLTTIYGTAGLRYKPWEWGSLDLTGYLDRQTSDGQFGERFEQLFRHSRDYNREALQDLLEENHATTPRYGTRRIPGHPPTEEMGDPVFRSPHLFRGHGLLRSGTGPVPIHREDPDHPADRIGGDGPLHRQHRGQRSPHDASTGDPQSLPASWE